ncbi:MAG: hypothetical protein OEW69_11075, partial [Nitrospirota bacterium]|nr:hypothetical protein [Nitrospirota bacterium]
RAKAGDEWDGNFLNWLTMRRVDVIRKVMTGGTTTSGEGSGYNRLIGEVADCDSRGRFKSISSADLYMPYSGTRKFVVNTLGRASCDGGGSGTSSFTVRNATDTGNEATFNVAVRVPVPVEGVLQSVVGARARLGLSFYRVNTGSSNQGGFVQVYISGGSLSSTVNQINLTRPNANTPLSETLWTMAGYFAQTDSISGIGSPGPRYSSGDYQINNNVDPLNYGTGGQPRYPSCAKSFVLYITDGEPCADGNLPANLRDYANGRSNFNCSGTGCPAKSGTAPETYTFPAATFTSCTGENNSAFCDGVTSGCYVAGIEDVALYAHTTDLRSATIGKNDMPGNQVLTLYTVFAWGTGSTLLKYATINGSFEDINGNNIPDLQSEWDENGDGVPDTYFEARDGSKIEKAVKEAFMSMIKRASSGTAASVLASGEGQGANLVQAVFFPRRRIGNDVIAWAGALQNLWYYVDPYFTKSDIREDSVYDQKLHLIEDYITRLYFDTTFQTVRARLCSDSDGDGDPDANAGNVQFENIKNLWETGQLLWSRDISVTPRTIYTTINGSSFLAGNFSIGNASTLKEYLQASDVEAVNIIRYTHGEDIIIDANADGINDYRLRTVTIGSDTHVWKLGDILDSTPKIASWIPLHNYDKVYGDNTYKSYVDSSIYKDRGMVFAGGNDGMLHAFKLGNLELDWSGRNSQFEMARLTNPDVSTPIGYEMWAFIPKNALPYLKYMTDPEYCHVYSIDLAPYVFDASIGGNPDDDKTVNSWKTVLVGGMRYGGACRGTTIACPDVSGDGSKDCVNTPVDVGGTSVGYSSYFALDITNPNSPQLLWEFSDPQLGFATTGPAV